MKTNIYFIESGDEVKIGRSVDVERRIEELQVGNSNKLKLLYTINNVDESFETFLHSVCERFKVRGEWFKKKDVLEFLLKHPYYNNSMILAE